MKKTLSLLLLASVLVCTFSCAPAADLTSVSGGYLLIDGQEVVPEYVMQIGSEKVGFDQYRYFFLNLTDSMENGVEEEKLGAFWTDENRQKLKNDTLDYILKAKALNDYAKEKGLSLSAEEKTAVKEYVDAIVANLGNEDFALQLKTLHLTESLYRRLQEEEKVYEKVFNFLFDEGGELAWSDEDYQKYYSENYLCATHILIDFEPGETKDNCPKTLEKANGIYDQCATADFDSLIKEHGKDENLKNYPTGYYFTEGDMVKSFYDAAKALEVGGISRPVVTDEGCHIIKRLEPDKEQVALQKESILWGTSSSDGSYSSGVYAELFEAFYTQLASDYAENVSYNAEIENYLKPGLVF